MSAIAKNQVFTAVHTVGGLLPADMLVRISEGKDVPGSKPADYGVILGSVTDEAERHWSYFKGLWRELRKQLPAEADGTLATDHTGIALNRWVLPLFNELGFGLLPEVGKGGIVADDDPEKVFPLSHRWQHVPIHVPSWATDLDKRPGGSGTTPPQSLVQEALNRTSDHLWAVVTNGRQLRLLRDSSALATAAYVEFDLEAIFDGELFNEFVLLYRLLHASRFRVAEGEPPATCWLEKWRGEAIERGSRALKQLRKNVKEAITTLGTGFLKHPANGRLREDLDAKALHAALLRMVYRMLFLFVAEDRDALHPPMAQKQAKERYSVYFSSKRLRAHARRRRGTAHGDQYEALRLVLDALGGIGQGNENGRPELGIPALGGLFSQTEADAPLRGLELSNEALLGAVRQLAQVRDTQSKRWRPVDYQHMGAEELGSVYEALLELVPKHSAAERTFKLVELAGNDRKTTGSYYTPSSLIETLLDSVLDPVIDDAIKRGAVAASAAGQPDESEAVVAELLGLTVCDPACGSGHFLVAAARRIAKKVAAVREGNPEPTVDAVRSAMHEVVARCIYGVDLNPMAVELAKVSLWLEALEPGKPLSFLDAHVKHGNALIGVTPSLLKDGIPDEAFKPIEGDDKKYAIFLAKTNKEEHGGQVGLFDIDDESVKVTNAALAQDVRRITGVVGEDLDQVRQQEAAYRELVGSEEYVKARRLADAWCAAFVWQKTEDAPRAVTQEVFRNLSNAKSNGAPYSTIQEIDRLSSKHRFFHWHLEFPEVFMVSDDGEKTNNETGWSGGFSCVLGNPPWERVAFNDDEFFSIYDPNVLESRTTSERKSFITQGISDGATWVDEYREAVRKNAELSHFYSSVGQYSLVVKGRLNTQSLFTVRAMSIAKKFGWVGVIVPTGVITDVPKKDFWEHLRSSGCVRTILDCENSEGIFPDVHLSTKFMLLALQNKSSVEASSYMNMGVYLRTEVDLKNPERIYRLPLSGLEILNPVTKQLPICLSRKEFDLLFHMTERSFPGMNVRPWVGFTSDAFSKYFSDEGGSGRVGLVEGKMIHQFDVNFADYSTGMVREVGAVDKGKSPVSQFYCDLEIVNKFLERKGVRSDWVLVVRDYVRAVDSRTAIASVINRTAPIQPLNGFSVEGDARAHAWALAAVNSFAYDFMAKQKTPGQHFNVTIMQQIPIVVPVEDHLDFARSRVLELSSISKDTLGFASDLGDEGEPFRWDKERRAVMRAELDALFFHLYGINRDDVDYIMESFPIVKKKDVAEYGTYRAKERILEIYDRMAEAGVSQDTPLVDGENFVSELTPPPGHGPRHTSA